MKYFCVGIKGSGMSTLAQILKDLGNEVSGYDDNPKETFTCEGLHKRDIKIYTDINHPIDKDTIVTYSKAFSEEHKELKYLHSLNLQFISYNELLGKLTSMFETTCVCGTHGKTTTSTMIVDVLKNNLGVNYFIGDGSGFAKKDNKLFVIESCEYQRHFLAYHPTIAVVTNIELEHTECYDGIEDIIATFNKFANKAKLVICCGDDSNVKKLKLEPKKITYGFELDNDVYATDVVMDSNGSKFNVYYQKKNLGEFRIPLVGKHMILNSLASITVGILYGVDVNIIKDSLNNFVTPKRRFKETVVGSNVVIDDYAHHPTELENTIAAARIKYPSKKVVAIFKPNTYSRTEALKDDFIRVLKTADVSYITNIDCNREKQEDYPNVNSSMLVDAIPNAKLLLEDDIRELLTYENAVMVFMSCANIYTLENEYIKQKTEK